MKITKYFFIVLLSAISCSKKGKVEFNNLLIIDDTLIVKSNSNDTITLFAKYKNTTDKKITINSVKSSCGCTTPIILNKEVNPMRTDSIEIKLALDGVRKIDESVVINTSDSIKFHLIKIIKR